MAKTKTRRTCEIPAGITSAADDVFRLGLSGQADESAKLRRKLVREIQKELEANPGNTRLWCLLGDLYKTRAKKKEVYLKAVKTNPNDAEANAELAELYAKDGDTKYAACIDRALQHCEGIDVEESIICAALEAARTAQDKTRISKALSLGRQRYPDSLLFAAD